MVDKNYYKVETAKSTRKSAVIGKHSIMVTDCEGQERTPTGQSSVNIEGIEKIEESESDIKYFL
ncbi:hypothetical protein [Ectobacillus panaciterrae]|uniref:hypothetical protein n=1 Tax=Ectobacillus panaciterrae TaxID=363872 RepID=UPI0004218BC3|nr:hypothetical protein [Ectobacillus panaciterrae]